MKLLSDLEEAFVSCFGLSDYRYLFVTGSGTFVNEIVISSLKNRLIMRFIDGEFGRRLYRMQQSSKEFRLSQRHLAAPLYETSISRLNDLGDEVSNYMFLDMVSAFPYYMPPRGIPIWTTVSSKQIGALPVLGIIAIHKSLMGRGVFVEQPGSCLDVITYLEYREISQTPHTPAMPLYQDLLDTLRSFDRKKLCKKIDSRICQILDVVGTKRVIEGGRGPVITFEDFDRLDEVANAFGLYKGRVGYQVFLWTGTDQQYDGFCKVLERIVR
jgi:aspartate aminotransferase-like enzyme